MLADHSSASPILETIRIKLSEEAGRNPTELRQEMVLGALAVALIAVNDSASLAWTVQAVSEDEPLLYHLTPLADRQVAFQEAWGMIYALRRQPQIAGAEPRFISGTASEQSG
jgi:hypothetical protein